jgi:hypothetical protein
MRAWFFLLIALSGCPGTRPRNSARPPPGDGGRPDATADAGGDDASTGDASNPCGCELGEICENGTCMVDTRGPYCGTCTAQDPNSCGNPRNFCLVGDQGLFCGVDCSLDQPCPTGYGCENIAVLSNVQCFSSGQCACETPALTLTTCSIASGCVPANPNDPGCLVMGAAECNGGVAGGPGACVIPASMTQGLCSCRNDNDCDGATCIDGLCCSGATQPELECVRNTGSFAGLCECRQNSDCPANTCDTALGICTLSREPCSGICDPIPCVNGACLLGQNCVPEAGSCP